MFPSYTCKKFSAKTADLEVNEIQGQASSEMSSTGSKCLCTAEKSEELSSHISQVESRDHMLSVLCGINHSADQGLFWRLGGVIDLHAHTYLLVTRHTESENSWTV